MARGKREVRLLLQAPPFLVTRRPNSRKENGAGFVAEKGLVAILRRAAVGTPRETLLPALGGDLP